MSALAIYKKGQGKYVRSVTAAVLALLVGLGINWMIGQLRPNLHMSESAQSLLFGALALVIGLAAIFGIFLLVNKPKTAEFMIMTESEMRKVHWPTRTEVFTSTRIVIVLTLLFAFLLFFVDYGFIKLFTAMGILPKGLI